MSLCEWGHDGEQMLPSRKVHRMDAFFTPQARMWGEILVACAIVVYLTLERPSRTDLLLIGLLVGVWFIEQGLTRIEERLDEILERLEGR